MSLVEVSPSTVIRFRLSPTASPQGASQQATARTAASVVKKASSVAMFGAIMPAPLRHAADDARRVSERRTRPRTSLGRVSVVMMARAASGPAGDGEGGGRRGDARADLVHGQRHADDAGRGHDDLARAGSPSAAATAAAVSRASARPAVAGGGVGAARVHDDRRARGRRPGARARRATGAAWARLVVKTPAAGARAGRPRAARGRAGRA